MIIKVKQIDIQRGTSSDEAECPIARAMRRQINPRRKFCVNGLTADVKTPSRERLVARIKLPTEARTFVRRFDKYLGVEPFSFRVKLPKGIKA